MSFFDGTPSEPLTLKKAAENIGKSFYWGLRVGGAVAGMVAPVKLILVVCDRMKK